MLSANPFVFIMVFFPYAIVLVSVIVMAVIGIMIAVSKVKPTRILGVAYIMSAVMTGFALAAKFVKLVFVFSHELISGFSTASTIISFICSVGISVCVFLFLYKRYGAKLVFIPVIIVSVIGSVANVVAYVLYRPGIGLLNSYMIGLTRCIIDFITATVSTIAIIYVLHKNRKKEDIIPRVWKFRIFIYVWIVIAFVYNCAIYILDIVSLGVSMEDWDRKYSIWSLSDVLSGFEGLFMIIGSLVALVIPIYVLVMASRKAKRIRAVSVEKLKC